MILYFRIEFLVPQVLNIKYNPNRLYTLGSYYHLRTAEKTNIVCNTPNACV